MNNLHGAILMILSMGGFALEDMFIKQTAALLPVGQIMLFIGIGGFVIFSVAAFSQRQSIFSRELLNGALILRNLFEIVGTFGFVTALALVPIATATAILQSMPLIVTLGAALCLGETVGWRRWLAIAAGFAGMLLIVRPGAETFDPAMLYAVLGAFGLAARDLATPKIPPTVSALQVSAWGFFTYVLMGGAMLLISGGAKPMGMPELRGLAAALTIGVVSYFMLTISVRIADLSAVAPFRYSRLLFALAVGVVVFHERPDLMTLSGAALIIASGLYTLARERALFTRALQG
ncbi:DMT family transporter [Tropicimonas sp.]|uniref:DMT family transporter n=1 Tax=Tropicimonas sp. TaxID=2067044 RepID=UPI003A8A54A0